MKIGLFSDVHGFVDALHKTQALFAAHAVDQVVCMGDLIEKGPDSDAVVNIIREAAIPCVQGNHDAKAQFGFMLADSLTDTSLTYLTTLPTHLTFQWAGLSVYACHANPWQDPSLYVYPTRPPLLRMVAAAVDASIIIMGHTHHPMCVEMAGKLLLNPGSIYANRDRPHRSCAILTLPEGHFRLYDVDTGKRLKV